MKVIKNDVVVKAIAFSEIFQTDILTLIYLVFTECLWRAYNYSYRFFTVTKHIKGYWDSAKNKMTCLSLLADKLKHLDPLNNESVGFTALNLWNVTTTVASSLAFMIKTAIFITDHKTCHVKFSIRHQIVKSDWQSSSQLLRKSTLCTRLSFAW